MGRGFRRGTCSRSAPGGRRRGTARAGLRPAAGRRAASCRRAAPRCRSASSCRTASCRRTVTCRTPRAVEPPRACRTAACGRTATCRRTAKDRRRAAGIDQGRPESSRAARDCGCSCGGGPRHLRDTLCARTLSRRRRRPRRRTHAEAVSSSCQPAAGHHRQPEVEQREPRLLGREREKERRLRAARGKPGAHLVEPGSTAPRRPLRREKHRGLRVDRIGNRDGGADRRSHGHLPARRRTGAHRAMAGFGRARRALYSRRARLRPPVDRRAHHEDWLHPAQRRAGCRRIPRERARPPRRSLRQGMRLAHSCEGHGASAEALAPRALRPELRFHPASR